MHLLPSTIQVFLCLFYVQRPRFLSDLGGATGSSVSIPLCLGLEVSSGVFLKSKALFT